MPTQVQFRRGNEGQNNNFKGAAGEISVNTSTNSVRVHNGITTGGFELARADLSNVGNVSLSGVVTATAFVGNGSQLTGVVGLSTQWTTTPTGIHTLSKVGIGTTNPQYDLHVIGNARITGILTVGNASITINGTNNDIIIGSGVTVYGNTGIISATAFYVGNVDLASASGYASTAGIATVASGLTTTASVNTSGILTATRFIGDGSGLTNIVATGTGVEVRDNGSVVGTARTLDFGDNLTVTFSAGIMTVTAASSGSVSDFVRTGAGIHTLGNVGVGTTNPTSVLSIGGNTGIVFTQSDIKVSISSFTSVISGIVTDISVFNLVQSAASQNFTVNNRSGTLSGIGFTATLFRNSKGEINSYAIQNSASGSGFVLNERIVIPGNLIGGSTPIDDLTLTVTGISGGSVTGIYLLNLPAILSEAGKSYNLSNLSGNLSGTNFSNFVFSRNATNGGINSWGSSTGSRNFSLYEKIIIPGNLIGGSTPADDFKLTVTGITTQTSASTGGNIFIGQCAGQSNTTGLYNNFLGKKSGYSNSVGCNNNFFGYYAGYSNNNGNNNNFFGECSGCSITNSSDNNFLGKTSGYNNTTGYRNSFIGYRSGCSNTTASWNIFMGTSSGCSNTIGSSNIFIGYYSGYSNTAGCYNSFFGNSAGGYNQTGNYNVFFGGYTGISTDKSHKVVIGSGKISPYSVFDAPKDADKQLAIGVRTDANPAEYWLVGDENFNVGIGTTNPTEKLSVGGNISLNQTTVYGSVQASTASTSVTGIHSGLSTSVYRSAEYTIQATQGTNYQAVKILAIHDGTTAYDTQYGNIYNTEVATFDVDISGGNVRLVAAASSTSTTNYTVNFIATRI